MKKFLSILISSAMLAGTITGYAQSYKEAELMNSDAFIIYDGNSVCDIVVDSSYASDTTSQRTYTQIIRAVGDLRQDIAMVTGGIDYSEVSQLFIDNDTLQSKRLNGADKSKVPSVKNEGNGIIIGTFNDSEIIKDLIEKGKLPEADLIRDNWEAFLIKQVDGSLVIAGSDSRGVIYGIYHLSEQIGVSPWYWFSDAPVQVKDTITVDYRAAYIDNGPDVKYRGIFINDEERLIDWAKIKFPTNNGTPDVNLYRHIFELMLRLKANTLWPAMHEGTTAFNMAKDENGIPINAKEAAKYGIVMASSHCEMMLRCNVSEWSEFKANHKNEYTWKDNGSFDYTQNKEAILGYWKERLITNKNFESILALGIRGIHDGDAETDNLYLYNNSKVEMMRDVIVEQRKLIKEVYGSETAVPQVFIPYKGMATIYNDGLKNYIPDDVMLMWAEDNYGNLRQTPTEKEAARSGGCGVYYHNSYWSWYNPKSYLWLNSNQIFYMAHQMERAYDTGAKAYWILNVGDIKPGDISAELFLNMAWDITTKDNIQDFLINHAMRDYNVDYQTAETIASVATEFYQLSGIKKAEFFGHANSADVNNTYFSENMIYPFSVTGEGDEGMRLVNKCNSMVDKMEAIYHSLDEKYRDVFYQQIYYHVLSYRNVAEEYVYLWKNNLAAEEGRYNSAQIYKMLSDEAKERIITDQENFWNCNNEKWTKVINYDHPCTYYNMNEGVLLAHDDRYKSTPISSGLGYSYEGGTLRFDSNAQNISYIDVFAKGINAEKWSITAPDWVELSKSEGETSSEERITVSVDFGTLTTTTQGSIIIYSDNAKIGEIPVVATFNSISLRDNSYIEANGKVVIEAEHYTENITGSDGTYWAVYENAGQRGDAMSSLPFDAPRADNSAIKSSARLRYSVYFTSTGTFTGKFYRIPTLSEGSNDSGVQNTCRSAIALDSSEPYLLKGNSTTGGSWKDNIMHMIEAIDFSITVSSPGWHDIYVYKSDSGIIFDRIVIETISGSVQESLVGPEESPNNISIVSPRQIGTLPDEIQNAVILPDITLTEDDVYSFVCETDIDSIASSNSLIADPSVLGSTVTITARHTGAASLTFKGYDAIYRTNVYVYPSEKTFVEENGGITINAASALLNSENAYHKDSNNSVHYWAFSDMGVRCFPVATGSAKANWIATNKSEGAKLLTVNANEKAGASAAYGTAPSLSYKLTIQNAGTYKLYVNTSNPNADADSYHVFIDNQWQYHSSEGGIQTDTLWYTYTKTDGVYLSKGEHTVTICAREAGFTLNSLALYKDGVISSSSFETHNISPITQKAELSFDIAPGTQSDGIVAFTSSGSTPSAWGDYAMTVRIRPDGTFDAYKGGTGYTYDNRIFYKTGDAYRVTLSVDIPNQLYSVYINGEILAEDYHFRKKVTDISLVTTRGGQDVSASLFLLGAIKVYSGAVISSAECKNGKTYYTIDSSGSVSDVYLVLYSGDVLIEAKLNPEKEGTFNATGDRLVIFNWNKETLKPTSDKKIYLL